MTRWPLRVASPRRGGSGVSAGAGLQYRPHDAIARYSRRMPSSPYYSTSTPSPRPAIGRRADFEGTLASRVRHRGAFAAVSAGVHSKTKAYMAASKHEQTNPTNSTLRSLANRSNPFVSDSQTIGARTLLRISIILVPRRHDHEAADQQEDGGRINGRQ